MRFFMELTKEQTIRVLQRYAPKIETGLDLQLCESTEKKYRKKYVETSYEGILSAKDGLLYYAEASELIKYIEASKVDKYFGLDANDPRNDAGETGLFFNSTYDRIGCEFVGNGWVAMNPTWFKNLLP